MIEKFKSLLHNHYLIHLLKAFATPLPPIHILSDYLMCVQFNTKIYNLKPGNLVFEVIGINTLYNV